MSRRDLGTLFNLGVIAGRTDGQLLERFASRPDEGAELAFAALVERHGPMVLRVCRGILRDDHEAMDAFQATFLVLVQKACSLWVQDSLGPWLHRVACRAAGRAKAQANRRRVVERRAAEIRSGQVVSDDREDGAGALHEELDRLPDRYRVPIVLCDLEGRTCEEVARHLGCPVGTVKSWRARGQKQLRSRLARRGLTGLTLVALTDRVVTPQALSASTHEAVVRMAAVRGTAVAVPATVLSLTKGVLRTMFATKLKVAAAALAAGLFVTAFAGVLASALPAGNDIQGDAGTGPAVQPFPKPVVSAPPPGPNASANVLPRADSWPLSLREAVLIGLANWDDVQIIEHIIDPDVRGAGVEGAGSQQGARLSVTIAPGAAMAGDPWHFKAEVMAHVRSIEQQYWSLAQQHVQLGSGERAVELAEEIVKREQSELEVGRGTVADVAESQQRLEQFRLDLLTKSSDVGTTEGQLRNILGLPTTDSRRIVPVTAPCEARLEPDWDAALAEMLIQQPEVARQKAEIVKAEGKSAAFADPLVLASHLADGLKTSPQLLQQLKTYQKIVHRKTHSLARFFLEIDANYKQLKTASRHRADALKRLEAQRASYEEGRITTDRYLDAVGAYTGAVAQEAQFRTTYNIAIMALEDAKGTLLTYDGITLSDVPRPASAREGRVWPATRESSSGPGTDRGRTTGSSPRSGSSGERPAPADANPPASPSVAGYQASTRAKELKFDFTVGGANPIRIRGSVTFGPAADQMP